MRKRVRREIIYITWEEVRRRGDEKINTPD